MYEMTFTSRISEIDDFGNVKITALLDYLQHIAYKHADQLGVGHHQIYHKNLTWLLLRYTIEISRYPQFEEPIKIKTWVAESNSPKYTIRDFEVMDENNNIICKATTSWLLFNYRKRQTVNFKEYWPDFEAEEKRALNYDFPGLQLPDKIENKKLLKVRLQDLDIQKHVNHISHIHWIMEGLQEKIGKKYELEKLEISYKEQGFYEDEISVETEILKKDKEIIKAAHQITKNKKNKLVSKAITCWKLRGK
jgi:medium-chain acyl-[acyl-carrier-protein] hydrolase